MRRKRIRHLLMPPAVILILMMSFITACEADFLDSTENQQIFTSTGQGVLLAEFNQL